MPVIEDQAGQVWYVWSGGRTGDNRPENLELWGHSHGYGIRHEDAPHCATCTCGNPKIEEES